ncbi:VOC family protein [Macrococcus equipercicus]|uniref:VOC family protein n=1 Tax=Macrococcus equipercicus TaxID=69967 RepID=A0A9Q9BR12_9STAP|nr:VOC family protein [Macrococcus equipercicus]UTH14101.1 VOC family protein [Macrococcus equipercicus]
MRQILGHHHASGITKDASDNYHFYAEILGMRLVKKTVNQDSPDMYHLFFGDRIGNEGTDITFFEIPMAGRTWRGSDSITRISLRVPTDAAIHYFKQRFDDFNVPYKEPVRINSRLTLEFEDFDQQRLALVSDENEAYVPHYEPWDNSPVPTEYQIAGLGPFQLDVSDIDSFEEMLKNVFSYRIAPSFVHPGTGDTIRVYSVNKGGSSDELHVKHNISERERPGRGSMHHIALQVKDEAELEEWLGWLRENGLMTSPVIDRFFFKSLYITTPERIVIELATNGPGFLENEQEATLGEQLSLPPFLEADRVEIESRLAPIRTTGGSADE